jgi:hypothetical protein
MKIKHPLVKGRVKEVKPFIYCVEVDDNYDRAMLFCRYQEFYESPYKQFRGKPFTWMEYMRFYKNSWKKNVFTYPEDWVGYNIPSTILEKSIDTFYKETEYDVIMNNEPAALEASFLASGKRVLLASELGCCTDKATALQYRTSCHRDWPFTQGRAWPNSGVVVGYAKDIRHLMRMAWREYQTNTTLYLAYTDQQLLCYLVSDGATLWTRAAVGVDHESEIALTTYQTNLQTLGFDQYGRVVFSNRTVPPIIHFNSPNDIKASQIQYAKANFPLLLQSHVQDFVKK